MNTTLQKIGDRMSGADRVVTDYWDGKLTFEFRDRSHVHGQYQVGSNISRAPDNAVGAVKIGDDWYWSLITPPSDGGDVLQSTLAPDQGEVEQPIYARPFSEWHEDYGDALWVIFPIKEPPYVGSPGCSDWPGYHTHWLPLPDCNRIVPTLGIDTTTTGEG